MKQVREAAWSHPLVESTSAALFVLSDGRVDFANPAAIELAGRSAEQLRDTQFTELLKGADGERFTRLGLRAGDGQPTRLQARLLVADGESRWVQLIARTIEAESGPATLVTAYDIDDLKRVEVELRQQEAELRLVRRAGRTATWHWRVASDELTISGLPENVFPDSAEQLRTSSTAFFDFVHPEDVEVLRSALRGALTRGERILQEIRLQPPGGELYWVVVRGRPLADDFGSTRHLIGVATDVTAARRAEEALHLERAIADAMLASVSDGVIRADAEGRIQYISVAAERMLGWRLEEAEGQPLKDVLCVRKLDGAPPLPEPLQREGRSGPAERCLVVGRSGEEVEVRLYSAETRDSRGLRTGTVLVLKDLSELQTVERGMVYLATHDALTDLYNRREFERRLEVALKGAREEGRRHALCFLDLDRFKLVNDISGHLAGDRFLEQFGSFLKCRFRESDTLARLGGDEFGILLEDCGLRRARRLFESLLREGRSFRFTWEDQAFTVGLSMGLVAIDGRCGDVDEVLGAADAACYQAKQEGGDRIAEHEAPSSALNERYGQIRVVQEVQDALRDDSFELFYQPIKPVVSQTLPPLYEVFVRLVTAAGEIKTPRSFIPVAERHRLVSSIDRWVLRHTLEALEGPVGELLKGEASFAINLSGQSLGDDRFLDFLLRELEYRRVASERLCFEITETAAVSDVDRALRFISSVRARGCRFILDDFGTGMSSFAYLRTFPVDFVKIDGQFVRSLSRDPVPKALVEAINHVGHVMQLKTIAEAVEDEATLETLATMRVDYAQGYWISRPAPLSRLQRRAAAHSEFGT